MAPTDYLQRPQKGPFICQVAPGALNFSHLGNPTQHLSSKRHAQTIQPSLPTADSAYSIKTKRDTIKFYARMAGYPTKKTWLAAINRNAYASWPRLTTQMVANHFTKSVPMVMGHMHAHLSVTQSAQVKHPSSQQLSLPAQAADLYASTAPT